MLPFLLLLLGLLQEPAAPPQEVPQPAAQQAPQEAPDEEAVPQENPAPEGEQEVTPQEKNPKEENPQETAPEEAAPREETPGQELPEGEEPKEEEAPQEVVPQKVELYRFSDRIVVKLKKTSEERVLYYYNKMIVLSEGDEVEQGSSAISEIRFEDDTRLRFFSRTKYRFDEVTNQRHLLNIEDMTRILILSKDELTLLLPGGTRLRTGSGECYLERDAYFIFVRNAGYSDVTLTGHLVDPAESLVPPGHTVSVPLYDPYLAEEAEPIVVREVSGMIVKTTGGYRFEEMPGFLVVSRPGLEEGSAYVGGARIFLTPGEDLKLRLPLSQRP